MQHSASRRKHQRPWRAFEVRTARRIESQLAERAAPCCPSCGTLLEARPTTRLTRFLPLDARGYDLDCRDCRRFFCVVRHTARSLRLVRMRRLVAAVRAVSLPVRERRAGDSAGAAAAAA